MHKPRLHIVVFLLLVLTSACNLLIPLPESSDTPTRVVEPTSGSSIPLTEAEVPRVTVEDAKAALDSGEAIIVDVRSRESHETSHVAGALWVPLGVFETDIAGVDLPKDQWIITYCT